MPSGIFFRGAKATPPFPIPPFPFLSFLFLLPLSTLPSPSPPSCPLKSSKVWGGLRAVCFPYRNRKHKTTCSTCLQIPQILGRQSHWRPHSNYWGRRVPHTTGIAAHVCKQRKLNYLKLLIQSTNTKRFSPYAVDNITSKFVVLCQKLLLHAAISQNLTTHSQKIPTTQFVSQNTVF